MFSVRQSKPDQWSKYYNNYNNGGESWCINGRPTDSISNVLANCVGYACARFNEIYCIETGTDEMKFKQLCCNAEDFWQVAANLGLKRGQEPKPGAIMVWEGIGSAAGHVAIVERVNNADQVYTSESGYDSTYFWNSVRYRGSGDWGIGAGYRFLGFIYNPGIREYSWKQEWHLYDEATGDELTGWQNVDGIWYYMSHSGAMQTGWQFINGCWYYMDGSGAMQKGWQLIGGSWYYLQEQNEGEYKEGEMRTGWFYDSTYQSWFLLASSGRMLTGWQLLGDKWYYLSPESTREYSLGAMYHDGTYMIDGKNYTFDSNGVWIG